VDGGRTGGERDLVRGELRPKRSSSRLVLLPLDRHLAPDTSSLIKYNACYAYSDITRLEEGRGPKEQRAPNCKEEGEKGLGCLSSCSLFSSLVSDTLTFGERPQNY